MIKFETWFDRPVEWTYEEKELLSAIIKAGSYGQGGWAWQFFKYTDETGRTTFFRAFHGIGIDFIATSVNELVSKIAVFFAHIATQPGS